MYEHARGGVPSIQLRIPQPSQSTQGALGVTLRDVARSHELERVHLRNMEGVGCERGRAQANEWGRRKQMTIIEKHKQLKRTGRDAQRRDGMGEQGQAGRQGQDTRNG